MKPVYQIVCCVVYTVLVDCNGAKLWPDWQEVLQTFVFLANMGPGVDVQAHLRDGERAQPTGTSCDEPCLASSTSPLRTFRNKRAPGQRERVRERERYRERERARASEREKVCVCVREREKERAREKRERRERVCVCERESERERECA